MKCEEVFKSVRSNHTKAYANFVRSGMGEDGRPIAEHIEEDPEYALKVYSSDFKKYVGDHAYQLYFGPFGPGRTD